ncbi:hypothetical protein GCM10007047_06380 [Cerasicoccus arenae]|uniref:Uncharacterized protein n=2 Tax=Cerasicoccus arenae TaxID=424488 RepID=A0A8J3GCE0_9BACT|nr:hypothetical protein GCM10007047_06380 [Cerasicoccus arenae]
MGFVVLLAVVGYGYAFYYNLRQMDNMPPEHSAIRQFLLSGSIYLSKKGQYPPTLEDLINFNPRILENELVREFINSNRLIYTPLSTEYTPTKYAKMQIPLITVQWDEGVHYGFPDGSVAWYSWK